MSTNRYLGMRVLRGPDWDQDEDDGGEGHLGTLVGVKAEEGTAEVVWDNGQVTTCRVGKEGKHDLRIYDNAPAGDCMIRGLMCQGCRNSSIYGTSWRCSTCSNFHLCSRCYHLGAHPLSHHFLRRDSNAHEGVAVGTRSGASRIPISGIFPEARVARGRDWEYGDVDGGPDSGGVVVEVVSPESGSARNAVRVSWDSGQSLQHRLGLHGKVDLVCTEEAPGPACYVSHLPVLAVLECTPGMQVTATPSRDGFKVEPEGEVKRDQDKTVSNVNSGPTGVSAENATRASPTGTPSHIQDRQDDRQHFAPGAHVANSQADVTSDSDCMVTTAEGRPDSEAEVRVDTEVRVVTEEEMRVGDRVEVGVDFDTFRDIQSQTASWSDNMAKCLRRTGVVKSVTATGEMEVDFEGHTWKINSICLKKAATTTNHIAVSERREFKMGDIVRIISDPGLLQEGQQGHGGWVSDMARAAGKVGRIKAIHDAGDLVVLFGQEHWIFNPDSCIPAPGSGTDFLYEGDTDGDLGGLMQGLHKEIANLLGENSSARQRSSGDDEGRSRVALLFDAVASGDISKAASLLDSTAGLVRETIRGATALDYAVHCRQEAAVRLLVAKGSDINRGDNNENTPLLRAIYARNCALTRTLVELGADVNLSNEDGQTPLHMAVDVDCPDIISLLLQHGASVNRRNLQGETPLFVALEKGDFDYPVTEALLSAEFLDLHFRRKNDHNVLHVTALYGRPRAAEKVLAREPSLVDTIVESDRYTALHIATINNHTEVMRELIKAKVPMDARSKFDQTALHFACSEDLLDCVKILVENGADINAVDCDHMTPLHYSLGPSRKPANHQTGTFSKDKGVAVAKYLIQQGARTDIRDKKGRRPLDEAPDALKEEFRCLASQRQNRQWSTTPNEEARASRPIPATPNSSSKTTCATCHQRDADIIFLPCAHKFLCRECAVNDKNCQRCGKSIKSIVDTRGNPVGQVSSHVTSQRSQTTSGREAFQEDRAISNTVFEDVGLKAGDRVVVGVDEETFKLIQTQSGCWDARMAKCLRENGEVKSRKENGLVEVEFSGEKWVINPIALTIGTRSPEKGEEKIREGDTVRIIADKKLLEEQQKDHGGWNPKMAQAAGKVGTVTAFIDGDAVVNFGQQFWCFSPASCRPAPGCSVDFIPGGQEGEVKRAVVDAFLKHKPNDISATTKETLRVPSHLQRFFQAVQEGDMEALRQILENEPALVRANVDDITALHHASYCGRSEIVRLLVAKGADLNKGDNDDDSPLICAIRKQKTETARVLVELGADVNRSNKKRLTPIHTAVLTNNLDVVRLLLQHKANVNTKDDKGNTPLLVAIEKDGIAQSIVDALVATEDLDLNAVSSQGFNALQRAALRNRPRIVRRILEREPGQVTSVNQMGRFTSLHIATNNNHTEIVELLIKVNAPVNAQCETGQTPLHLACNEGYLESAKILVENGADINATDLLRNTPLHMCFVMTPILQMFGLRSRDSDRCERVARYLIELGVPTDVRNMEGLTPLDAAPQAVRERLTRFIDQRRQPGASKNQNNESSTRLPGPRPQATANAVKCVTCSQRDPDVIFLPCAHKVLCRQCAGSIKVCLKCGRNVQSKVDTEGNVVTPMQTVAPTNERTAEGGVPECKVQ